MEFWIKAAQLILSLSILVVLHELGHFIPAKLFKTRVEKFYLFFDAGFSLFKFKKGDTEYGIGWIPLGGYVKISGMIDESMDKEQMKKPAEPWEFRSKPAWQRLIIMVGGVVVNLILGFVIYAGILMYYGEDVLHPKNAKYGLEYADLMEQQGFQDGDNIIAIDGEEVTRISAINSKLILDDIETVTVMRDGASIDLKLPEDFGQMMIDSGVKVAYFVRSEAILDQVLPEGNAIKAGLEDGDKVLAINNEPIQFFDEMRTRLGDFKSEEVELKILRNGTEMALPVEVSEVGTIGAAPLKPSDFCDYDHLEYGFFKAIPAGFNKAKNRVVGYVISLKFLFSKAGIQQVGSFGTFGQMFDASWNWEVFWSMTALFSLILAVMNILPIPALDGGHVMFLIYEMITGKPPKEKFMEKAQLVGMILLLALMVYAIGNDVYRFLIK